MGADWRVWAAGRGYLMACGKPSILDEVRAELEGHWAAGRIDDKFYRENLTGFRSLKDSGLSQPKTLLIVVVPRPAHRLIFQGQEGPLETILPPHYESYGRTGARIRAAMLAEVLEPGASLVPLRAPWKLLAARLGLVTYGRNNITYAPGVGSYHQLVGFLTEAELTPLTEPRATTEAGSPACCQCHACIKACPTGAIRADRFLIGAERCLTLFNESPEAWPPWVPPPALSCLIGCLRCQDVCPQNAGKLGFEPLAISFDAAETARLLAGEIEAPDPFWAGIKAKLVGLDLPVAEPDVCSIIGRNLRALMATGGNTSAFRSLPSGT